MIMSVVLLAQESTSTYDAGSAVAQHETHVTPAQALNVGYTFMRTGDGSKGNGTKSGSVSKQAMQLVYTGQAYDSLTSTITDCYYVFALQPKGFVIVAADDRVEPILGYSYDNDFVVANMPDHVRGWLGSYEKQIQAVLKNNLQAEPASQAKWSRLKSGQSTGSRSGGTVGPLLTTTWDQSQYYNNLCPADASGPDGHALTGCVATAMAQIIHYWSYPAHGRGSHSYESNYGTLTVNYDSTNYDYTLMPDALTSTSTTQEVNAVATLMRDCGVAVNMGYGPTESGSFNQDARAALINFYRFSSNLSIAKKAYYSESEWTAMLRADLDNNRPVYYSGQGSGGHAFVCDGYNADGYYHFNFGWGGFADGWFLNNSIIPDGSYFINNQAALFGIVPDSTGNIILGQTQGTSTFTVDEPLEFYHLMGNNAYVGGFYDNSCNSTIHFITVDTTKQIVVDILDFEDQTLAFYDGDGNFLRSLSGGSDNDLSPVVSYHYALNIEYSGNMYYAGFKLNISQIDNNGCRMVSNITAFMDTTTVHLIWTENGNATQWEIEYGVKEFSLGTGTIYTTTTTTADFHNLQSITEYDFYIRAVCDSTHYGPWNKTTLMVEGPFWQDIVTSQPAGYVYNAETNSVEITTAEQLAWWAKTGIDIDGHLAADIDLSGHRWKPTELFYRNFNGHGHVITNLYVINGSGFFSECAQECIIENVGLTNAYINNTESGGLCGTLRGTMRNCYVTNSIILAESYAGGLVCFNTGLIINCYVNADVTSYNQGGLLACYSYGTIRNCYSTGTLPLFSWCYYGSIAAVVSGEISHCYSNDACSARFTAYSVGITTITDVSYFENASNGWSLLTPIVFDEVSENNLLSALNRSVEMYNDSAYYTWMADTGNRNGGFPVFGNRYINLCPNVTDVSIQNVIVDNQHAVTIGWTENGDASQWLIRYKDHFQPDTTYSYVITTSNPDTLFGIPLGYEYDFNVRAICDTDHRSGWGETQTEIIDLPYWTDIVTTKPDGYVEDADGNVEIYSTEGLAWISIITNGLQNQPQNSLTGKTVTLKSDINLEGYRWYPIGDFVGIFDGENHRISNIYMNSETGGLFGSAGNFDRVVVVKNVILEGGTISCGRGYGGGLIGLAHTNCEISNCHVSTTIHSKYNVPTGALCGEVQTGWSLTMPTILVSNCSASGTVYGGSQCGNLIGSVLGNVVIRNCYATGDVYPASEITGEVSCRGVMIGSFVEWEGMVNNCFSTGMAYNCLPTEMNMSNSSCYGKVLGCLSFSQPNIHYLYGQNNVNAGLAEFGLDGFSNNSLFTHSGTANSLLSPVSIDGTNYSDLLDALNAWVVLQNDTALRTWVLDTLTGHPVFGDFYVPSCYTPTDLIVSQATTVGDPTIKTQLAWTQKGEPDHWEVLYVASGESIESGTIIPVNDNPCVMVGIPVGKPLDFYVRAVCGNADTSTWCNPVTYIPDKLRWTEVVTSQPEGYQKKSDGNVYISSAEGLAWVASIVNRLNGNNSYYGFGDIILTEDIDLSAYRWTAIGDSWEHGCYHSFNGNNHVVSGLYCNELSAYQGLFGFMQRSIQNLTLTQCYIHGTYETGAIAGHCNNVNIRNCIVNGSVSEPFSGMLICASYNGTIENSCFISKDNKNGNPVVIIGGGSGNEIANCYVGDSDSLTVYNRYYNSSTYYGDFSGDGYTWTLNSPQYINGTFQSDLVDALNTWVDANNINGQYRRWVADTAMVNDGYPIFESVSYPAVGAHDTVMATGYYSWHGMVFTSDTVVNDTITTLIGYDSVVTHHIIVIPSLLTEITVDTCSSYIWNNETYSKTGDYVQTFPSVGGGDSVVVIHLTINPLTGVDEQIACGNSYMWIDGVTYVANNFSATHRLQTADGCDSVVTLHLTFGNNTGDTNAVACDSFDWYEKTNLTQSGDYTQTFINASGCDSVVTLHLTVNHSVAEFVEATACNSYVWNDSVYTQSGNYTQTFTNANGCDSIVTLHLTVNYTTTPSVTTSTVNDITPYSAICGGNVIADGCAEMIERGICWSTSQNPTVADSHTSESSGVGTFSSQLIGLEPNTIYHVRAYATNGVGTAYGEELMFTTASQFTCGENLVVGYYGYTTMNYGSQCWMTQNLRNPSVSYFDYPDVLQACPTGWHLPDNNDWNTLGIHLPSSPINFGDGDYWTSTLIPYQDYQGNQFTLISPPYVNSNSVSGSGGAVCEVHDAAQGICQVHTELSVRCLRNENAYAALPTVTTQAASDIMPNTAICGGIITSDGGATVTERGVCWSVSENPTIADSHTINGGGAGIFTSQLTGLELNITYHVRAYATNSAGTAYGEEVTFTTDLCGTLNISISGEDGISYICESDPVTLTANVEADGSTPENLHYTWYEDGQVRDNMTFGLGDTNEYAEYWASQNSIYSFSVVVTYGAHLSCVAQSEERYVRVYPQPATPVVTVDQTTIYDGGQVVLSATSPDLYNISYTWYKNGVVIPGATGAHIVDNPTTVGDETTQYVYTVEVSHLYTGCTSEPSEPTVVTVNATPTATVTAEGNTMLCEGETVTLHVDVTPANDSYSYQWYVDGSLISGATSADYIVSKSASDMAYNFTVAVYANGGLDILVPGPAITVMPAPFVTALTSGTSICEGGTSTLTAWVAGSSANYGYNFQWFRSIPYPDGTSDTNLVGTNATYTTSSNVPVNNYTYWVEVTSEYGCSSQSNPLTLTVKPNPSVFIRGNTTFCAGGSTTLYANVTPDQNAYYVWYKDGVETGSHTTYIPVTDGGVYMVKATVNGCEATDNITITVNDLPATPVVTVDNDIVFDGDQVTLSVTNSIPNTTYTWYRNGEIIPNTNQASLIEYPTTFDGETTVYTYTVVAAFDISGCVSDVSDYTWVTIFPTPEANITVNGDTTFCEGGFATLRVNVTPHNGPTYTYQWYEDGMPIPGATYSSYYVNKPARSTPYNFHVVVSANGSYNVTAYAPAVTIVADPQVEITMADGYPAAFCDGGSTVLQANATGGLGDFSYQWYKNGSTLAGETNQTLALNNLYYGMYDSYTVRVTQYGASCAAFSDLQMVRVYLLSYNTLYKTACEDYTWNGTTYAQTGEYTQTFTGANGCDSIVTLHLTVNYANSGDTTAVADDRFDWYEHTYLTMSGDYTHVFTNQIGCDSVVTLHLTVTNPTISVQDTVMTAGYFIWHGMVFTSDTVLFETIPVLDGYDSLVVYHIFVTPTPLTVLTVNSCDSYTLNGQTYDESGDYVQTFPISSGIDSVVVLYLTIFPADSTDFAETACEFFTWEGTTYTTSGDYTKTFTNTSGCDSVVTLHLTIFLADSTDFAETACDSYEWNGETFTTSGDYTRTLTNASGCDSVVTLHLTIQFATYAQFADTACGSYEWNGTTYTVSGDYEQTFTAANGCDSVVTLHLTVNQPSTGTDVQTACGSYTWIDGISYSESNSTATYTLTNAVGCDSIVTLNLTIFPADSTDFAETVCESYEWNGETFITSGDYTRTLTNMNGCDSVVTLHLTVNQPVAELVEATACGSYEWNGQTYTISGDYEQSFTAANGCDSVVTLHLTVNHGTHNIESETTCESFTWHGATYTTSGTYTYQYTNANGCASVDTLILTVNHGTHNVETETACESFTWHGTEYTASGTYTYEYMNDDGCASVDTLYLTVNHGTHYVESETTCESFTWHGTEYTASGTYTYEYNNENGCASVDTLHLTINFAQSAQFAVTTADSCYIWNAETYCESGDYTQTLTAANGCDSVVTLHLTITVGIDDHNLSASMTVYPNPTNGIVNVQCTMYNVQVGTMEYHVFDAYGKLVDVVETRCTTSLQTAQIDLSGFANGVYFVKAVADGNVVAVRKVVKR